MPGIKPRPKADRPRINSCPMRKPRRSEEPPFQGGAFDIFMVYREHFYLRIMIDLGRHFCVSTVMPGMKPRPKANPLLMNLRPLDKRRLSEAPPFQGGSFDIFILYVQHFHPHIMIDMGRHFCVSTVMPDMKARDRANPPFINSCPTRNPR
jgi:hypothetical protein